MKHSLKQNWIGSLELILKKPIILLPFIVFASLEALALELIYFFPRKPFSFIVVPIVRKFFGEGFTHYPGNFLVLPRLFYYLEIALYIAIGGFLIAIAINIFQNIKLGLPLKAKALINNAAKRYWTFVAYGVLSVALMLLLKNVGMLALSKFFNFASGEFPNATVKFAPFIAPLFLFLANTALQVFLILILPIMVIRKMSFIKALGSSVYLGVRHFFSLFILIFVPFFVYLPITLLKSFSVKLASNTFPEIIVYITLIGIITGMFIDAFVVICACQFITHGEKGKGKK